MRMENENDTDNSHITGLDTSPVEDMLDQATATMNSLEIEEDLITRFDDINLPSKGGVASQAAYTGHKFKEIVEDSLGNNCKFARKGSLFDESVNFVSDVDILLCSKDANPFEVIQALILSENLQPFRVMYRTKQNEEVEFDAPPGEIATLPAFVHDAEVVSISCAYSFQEHMLPFDVTATNAKQHNESIGHRIQKIRQNAMDGKFDKVVQRIKPLFNKIGTKTSTKTALKTDWLEAMNNDVGRIRFIAKQLHLSIQTGQQTPFVQKANLSDAQLPLAFQQATAENRRAALSIIRDFRPRILDWVRLYSYGDALLEALDRCA